MRRECSGKRGDGWKEGNQIMYLVTYGHDISRFDYRIERVFCLHAFNNNEKPVLGMKKIEIEIETF